MNEIAEVEQLRELGRLEAAERKARAVLTTHPDDTSIFVALAAVLLDAGRLDEGLACAESAVATDPNSERAHRLRGLLLVRLGRHSEATQAAHRAVSIEPEGHLAALGYASILHQAGRLSEALPAAHRALELDPESITARLLLAHINAALGHREAARNDYHQVLRLDPDHGMARHELAVLDVRSYRLGQALRGLIDAGAIEPALPTLRTNVTALLWRLVWQLRVWLAVMTLLETAAHLVATHRQAAAAATPATRITAGAVLMISAAFAWWSVRNLPRQARPVVWAAIQASWGLSLAYCGLGLCFLVYALICLTGIHQLTFLIWITLILLAVLTFFSTRRRG